VKILYIHGLGGQAGGALERALAEAGPVAGHEVITIRWGSGEFRNMIVETLGTAALEALADPNPIRGAARFAGALYTGAQGHWESALGEVTQAALKTVGLARELDARDVPFSIVGFSLGGRALLTSLLQLREPPAALHKIVFCGAAVSASAFGAVPEAFLKSGSIVNVHSAADEVLNWAFPFAHGREDAAGRGALGIEGITNVPVDAGHLSYDSLAETLVYIATSD
jgi:hypothetical protein